MRVDSHEVAERFRRLTHERYGEALRRDPSLLEQGRTIVEGRFSIQEATFADRMWAVLLTLPLDEVRRAMTQDGPDGSTLRSGSPFSILLGVTDRAERTALWNRAATEVGRSRTSPTSPVS